MRKTKRLIIRPIELHDYENWRQAYSMTRPPQNEWDEAPWKESELTRAKFKKYLKTMADRRRRDVFYTYGVFRKDDGVLIGHIMFMDISRLIFQNAYFGYRIFNNYWGEGYATEACRAGIDIAFKDLKLHRIEAGIEPHNKRSIRVAKTIGLRREGLSKRRLYVRDQWKDMQIYAATCEDFGFKFKIR